MLLVAAIAVAAIVSSMRTIREHRRREWMQRRVWTVDWHGVLHHRSAYPPDLRS